MTIGSLFHIVIPPMAATFGTVGVMICRMIQGLTQDFLYPCISNLLSRWTPLFERSRISNFVYGAANVGIAISMPLTGAICGSKSGWPLSFYVCGSIGIAWAIIFAIFAENSPSQHKRISPEEREYIESSTSITETKKVLILGL